MHYTVTTAAPEVGFLTEIFNAHNYTPACSTRIESNFSKLDFTRELPLTRLKHLSDISTRLVNSIGNLTLYLHLLTPMLIIHQFFRHLLYAPRMFPHFPFIRARAILQTHAHFILARCYHVVSLFVFSSSRTHVLLSTLV